MYMPDDIVTDDAEMTFDARSYIKTLTPASVGAHPERCITKGAPVLCCRFWGEARGIAQALSDPNNPKSDMLTLLDGSFKADSYNDDGEVFGFRGDWCAPPLGMPGIISELTKQADEGVENPLVEFDFEVWALPANNPTKRTWGARDMMPKRADQQSFLSDQSAAQRRIAYGEAVGGSFAPVAKRIEHDSAA
jgi:hypothetical protein